MSAVGDRSTSPLLRKEVLIPQFSDSPERRANLEGVRLDEEPLLKSGKRESALGFESLTFRYPYRAFLIIPIRGLQ